VIWGRKYSVKPLRKRKHEAKRDLRRFRIEEAGRKRFVAQTRSRRIWTREVDICGDRKTLEGGKSQVASDNRGG